MAGEHILVVDNSAAVQELCRATLESEGYRVTVASNGLAALTYPGLPEVDLLIIDLRLNEMSGLDAVRSAKGDAELLRKPILLLVPEEEGGRRESVDRLGANAWLQKPFEPQWLLAKVVTLLEEKRIMEQARTMLQNSAEAEMRRIAETAIQQAVEQRVQIIAERALQSVVTMVDQRARHEVDAKVNELATEKEQELVRATVQEVARSMVEKLAERKVTEAMESILREETDKTVRRAAEAILPELANARLKEAAERTLPKEVQRRVQKEAENLVPQASEKVVSVIDTVAQKLVPKIARELIAGIAEHVLADAMEKQMPKQVSAQVAHEVEALMRQRVGALVRESASAINRRVTLMTLVMVIVLFLGIAALFGERLYYEHGRAARSDAAAETPPPTPASNPFLKLMDKLPKQPVGGLIPVKATAPASGATTQPEGK